MTGRYTDPRYQELADKYGKKYGLPDGWLGAILTKGERSNADQVSEAGARTVFQVIPSTRDLVLKKYGVDAYLSEENAAEAAALVGRDAFRWASQRTQDPTETRRLAAGYYHAGGDTGNWGRRTQAYMDRVEPVSTYAKAVEQSAPKSGLALRFKTYKDGSMPADEKAAFERDVAEGKIVLPRGMKVASAPEKAAAPTVPTGALAAWQQGKMSPDDAAEFEALVKDGTFTLPAGQTLEKLKAATQIPGTQAPTVQPERSIGDRIIGAGEAALTMGSSLTAPVGAAVGTIGGVLESIGQGTFGTPQAANRTEELAAKGSAAYTYAPRTEAGQEYVGEIGQVASQLIPVGPLTPQLSAMGTMSKAATGQAVAAARPAAAAVMEKARAVPQMIRREQAPTSGTLGSVGAAGTDAATLRTQAAADLPVPVQLTKGQRERSQEQLRFETETAKDPAKGRDLREFAADQNAKVMQNLDAFVEGTEAVLPDDMEVGRSVGTALANRMAREKAQIRTAYKAAEKAGEMREPVPLAPVIKVFEENASAEGTAPVIGAARKELERLMKLEGTGDSLSIGGLENLRKFIIANTDEVKGPDVLASSVLKQAIDAATENAGGDIYKSARALRRNFANRYENRALINDLVSNRKAGSVDRKVALENVVRRSVFQGSREELGYLRAVLQGEGQNGQQAWRELQGAVARQIQERALSNVGTDIRGNPIVSAAKLDSAIKQLEVGKKLEFIFGQKGAQQFRDLNELAKVIYTQPPGTVNTSNTASVLVQALAESGITGSMTGLPIPVLSGLKVLSMHVKDRRIQRRIDEALGRAKAQEKRAPGPNTPPRTFH